MRIIYYREYRDKANQLLLPRAPGRIVFMIIETCQSHKNYGASDKIRRIYYVVSVTGLYTD